MSLKNGAGPATDRTVNEARKDATDRAPSTPHSKNTQVRTDLIGTRKRPPSGPRSPLARHVSTMRRLDPELRNPGEPTQNADARREPRRPGQKTTRPIPDANAGPAIAEKVKRALDPGSWRAILPIHPAAEKIPVATDEEKRSLAGDIKRNGLKVPVTLVRVAGGKPQLLDGRHRLDLLENTDTKVIDADGNLLVELHQPIIDVADDAEAERLSLSLNAHRRQMKEVEWRKLLQAQIQAAPEKSNRQIGAIVGVSHPTVAAERKKLESTGKILPVEKTVGADGKARKQPAKKKRRTEDDFAKDVAAKKPKADFTEEANQLLEGLHGLANHLQDAGLIHEGVAALIVPNEDYDQVARGAAAARGFLARAEEAKRLAVLGYGSAILKAEDVTDEMIYAADDASAVWNKAAQQLRRMKSAAPDDGIPPFLRRTS